MALFKRRLFFWLLKAYIKRWGRRIFLLIVIGALGFFLILNAFKFFVPKFLNSQKETVGIVGAYTLDSLPSFILNKLSVGLTSISKDGMPRPALAKSWKIDNNGKQYTFFLKRNMHFSDGSLLTSNKINYSFSDVRITRPNKFTLVFSLKESYSPFLITVSSPIFKNGFVGIGDYKIIDLKLNGPFVEYITLASIKNPNHIITYRFYPSMSALKTAYLLGEIRIAQGLDNARYKNTSFYDFVNTEVKKTVDYSHLVTIFYNTKDPVLSDARIRDALSYAVPDHFPDGLRNYLPLSPYSWAYNKDLEPKTQDYVHAHLLLLSTPEGTASAKLSLKIETLPAYLSTAKIIKSSWEKLGIRVSIEKVNTIPSKFQIFLGSFILPKDPDEYALWHSGQNDNISNYKNLRIDKLLEDGRRIVNFSKRQSIYMDFQKYLLADSPATFLYFPYTYNLYRK